MALRAYDTAMEISTMSTWRGNDYTEQMDLREAGPFVGRERDFKAEQAGLGDFGVSLPDSHLDGYRYKPDRFKQDKSGVVKPWEVSLSEQLDQAAGELRDAYCGARRCETAEGWNNEEFLFEIRAGIAYCTLNRPTANNAMNDAINDGFHDAIRILKSRPDVRIAVLTGNGRMFCAGGDPKSFQASQALVKAGEDGQVEPQVEGRLIAATAQQLELSGRSGKNKSSLLLSRDLYEWATLPQFTIACLNGSAMGGGVGLLSACDMAVAVKTAHITLSEVKLGVIPAVISPHVIRTTGMANAKKLFVTAENCTMQQAKSYGLVQRIVNDASEFPAAIREISQRIQVCAPGALGAAKKCILECLNEPMCDGLLEHTAAEYTRVRRADECEEGMKALMAKKRPNWVESVINVREV